MIRTPRKKRRAYWLSLPPVTPGTGKGDKNTARLLGGPTIEHYHQAIALVVAETFEQARAAASLVQAHYRRNKGAYSLADEKQAVNQPPEDTPDKNVGDFDGAFTSAAVKIDDTYTTPDQSHMAMEPHASMAVWDGSSLPSALKSDDSKPAPHRSAKTLKVPVEKCERSPRISAEGLAASCS